MDGAPSGGRVSTFAVSDKPHVVLCKKANGTRVVFSRYPDRKQAELACERLLAVVCHATVEIARVSDVSGLTRRDV